MEKKPRATFRPRELFFLGIGLLILAPTAWSAKRISQKKTSNSSSPAGANLPRHPTSIAALGNLGPSKSSLPKLSTPAPRPKVAPANAQQALDAQTRATQHHPDKTPNQRTAGIPVAGTFDPPGAGPTMGITQDENAPKNEPGPSAIAQARKAAASTALSDSLAGLAQGNAVLSGARVGTFGLSLAADETHSEVRHRVMIHNAHEIEPWLLKRLSREAITDKDRRSPERSLTVEGILSKAKVQPPHAQPILNAAYRDPLTGLYNDLHLQDHLDSLTNGNRTLLTFKLDQLKEINDEISHAAGDAFLSAMGSIVTNVLGSRFHAIRRSPTGFAVFLPFEVQDAALIAEAIRLAAVERLGSGNGIMERLGDKTEVTASISVGVAAIPRETSAASAYIVSLLHAKQAREFAKDELGGNRTVVSYEGRAHPFEPVESARLAEQLAEADLRQIWPASGADFSISAGSPADQFKAQDSPRGIIDAAMPNASQRKLRQLLYDKIYRNRLSFLRNRRWLIENIDWVLANYSEIHAIDIDHFGDWNKLIGEESADSLLGLLGRTLARLTRDFPLFSWRQMPPEATSRILPLHLSGEEFFIFTRMGRGEARRFAHRYRQHVKAKLTAAAETMASDPLPGSVSISVGIRTYGLEGRPPGEILEEILNDAEEALKVSKNIGRDWVSMHELRPGPSGYLTRAAHWMSTAGRRIILVGGLIGWAGDLLGELTRALPSGYRDSSFPSNP